MFERAHILMGTAMLLSYVASAAMSAEVTLRERVECRSSVVRLGDVAEVAGESVVEQQRLAGLLLMPAPAPGTQRFVRQREVQDMLAAHGEDVNRLRVAGADQVAIVSPNATEVVATAGAAEGGLDRQAVLAAGRITRSAPAARDEAEFDELEAERIRGELDQLIVEYLAVKAGRRDAWRLSFTVADRYLALLATATSAPKCMGGLEPWVGRQRFVISFSTAKGTVQMPVYAEVALATPVIVAIRPIEKGAIITAAHVDVQTIDYMPTARGARLPFDSVERLIGMEALQTIKVGEMVFVDQVRAPLLVKKGDEVSVVSHGRGIRVRTSARALQDAALGELVRVETVDRKESYDARVTGTRQVAVFAPSRGLAVQPRLEQVERGDAAWK